MRHINRKMTKAAFDRLFLMKDPQGLPLPPDPKLISPFEMKFNDVLMSISYQGRDLMYVKNFSKENGAHITLTYPENDEVDRLMNRLLNRVMKFTDECGRLLATETKDRLRREKEEAEEHKRAKEAQWLVDKHTLFDGGLTDGPPQRIPMTQQTLTKLVESGNFSNGIWRCSKVYKSRFDPRAGGIDNTIDEVYFSDENVRLSYNFIDGHIVPKNGPQEMWLDPKKMKSIIEKRIEAIDKIQDIGNIINMFADLPPARYSILNALNKVDTNQNKIFPSCKIEVENGLQLVLERHAVNMLYEGLTVARANIRNIVSPHEPWITKEENCLHFNFLLPEHKDFNTRVTSEQKMAIGSLWAEASAKQIGYDPELIRLDVPIRIPIAFEQDDLDHYDL